MRRITICLLVSCALLLAGDKKGSSTQAQDRQKCMDKCAKTYENCVKNAKNKTAAEGCAGAKSLCQGACNK